MKNWFAKAAFAIFVFGALVGVSPARAQGIPVYDNMSFIELVQQFEQGAQQLAQLQQQLQTQLNMIRSLPSTIMPGLGPLVQSTQQLMSQVQEIQNVGPSLTGQLNSLFPTGFAGASPQSVLSTIASMTSYNRQALTTAMGIQGQIAQNEPVISSSVNSAVSASQGAAGPTAAIQATNQILGAMSQQLAQQDDLLISAQRAVQQQALQRQAEQAAVTQYYGAPGATDQPLSGQGF